MSLGQQIPDAFAILPSDAYVFDQAVDSEVLTHRIVGREKLTDGVEVLAANLGLLAFDFKHSALAGRHFPQLEAGDESADEFISLQALRLRVAVFVSACIYGVHAKRAHATLEGPLFPGLSDIYNWMEVPGPALGLPAFDKERLLSQLSWRRASLIKHRVSICSISTESFVEGAALADRLMTAAHGYAVADPVAMVAMTYQAAVLHGHQHAGASIALAAVIVEAAVEELMFAFGLVAGVDARLGHPGLGCRGGSMRVSRRQLKDLGFNGRVTKLEEAGIFDAYLIQRINALRGARNALMHDAQDAVPRQSGEGLTVMRDILWLCTGETGFELNVGWSYRC